ncbi:MAG: M48 family metallopeptidase [Acidobacteria bacterium]|nr:M48 family metallopeptidase [Acidobacteriota bacterium]
MRGRLRQLLAMTLAAFLGFGIHSPLLAEKKKKKKKHADVENVGNREINKRSLNFYSIEREIALGKRLSMQIEQNVKLINDPEVNEYVNRVGQNLVRNSDSKVPFTIKIVDSDQINAFALPGGFFYVNSGLITSAESESEMAGVMAHEIAHVTARHGTENATKGQIANYAMLPLIFMGGALGYGLYQAAGFLIPLQFLHFSRKAETEADFLGLQYLYKTGYDPTSSVSFFEKIQAMEKKKPGKLAKAFRTHPPTGDRIAKTQDNIADILPDRDQYVINTSEFDRIKAKLLAMENASRPRKDQKSNRPSLKRRTSGEVEEVSDDPADEERPTLKRRK